MLRESVATVLCPLRSRFPRGALPFSGTGSCFLPPGNGGQNMTRHGGPQIGACLILSEKLPQVFSPFRTLPKGPGKKTVNSLARKKEGNPEKQGKDKARTQAQDIFEVFGITLESLTLARGDSSHASLLHLFSYAPLRRRGT